MRGEGGVGSGGGGGAMGEEGHGAMGRGGGGPWTVSKSASTMYTEPILATECLPNTYTFGAYFSSYRILMFDQKDSIVLVCHYRRNKTTGFILYFGQIQCRPVNSCRPFCICLQLF